jgi:TRAP-type C4-dicarboxylate transport system permease small subunit
VRPNDPAWLRGLLALNRVVACVLFAALTIVVLLQVLTRFVLHLPMIWSEELARFLFFWVVMLGAALSVKNRRHFVIDFSMGAEPGPKLRFFYAAFPDLCVLLFTLFLLVQGSAYAREGALRTATNSHINMALVYAAIPVFAALSIVYSAVNLLRDIRAFRSGPQVQPPLPPSAE